MATSPPLVFFLWAARPALIVVVVVASTARCKPTVTQTRNSILRQQEILAGQIRAGNISIHWWWQQQQQQHAIPLLDSTHKFYPFRWKLDLMSRWSLSIIVAHPPPFEAQKKGEKTWKKTPAHYSNGALAR